MLHPVAAVLTFVVYICAYLLCPRVNNREWRESVNDPRASHVRDSSRLWVASALQLLQALQPQAEAGTARLPMIERLTTGLQLN